MAAGSNMCCLLSINLLQDNDDLPALHFVPKSRVTNGTALNCSDMQNVFVPSGSEIQAFSSLPQATGSEGTEEVRIYNWRAEVGGMEVMGKIYIPAISECTRKSYLDASFEVT